MKILLSELFDYETGNLPALELTDDGDVPLVYGTTKNNGVIKLVKVDGNAKLFGPPLITVSYLGTAFVQRTKFTTSVVDKSNITVLKPKEKMSIEALYYYCVQINKIAKFGYSYGRRMNQKQLNKLYLVRYEESSPLKDIATYLPTKEKGKVLERRFKRLKPFSILDFFIIAKGDGAYLESFDSGKTPLISATSFNNGVAAKVDAEPIFKKGSITVERIKSTAFVQLEDFLTVPDDIYILSPIKAMSLPELFMYCYLIRREAWKYSYGRKLTQKRLEKIVIHIPLDESGSIDFTIISSLFSRAYGSEVVSSIYSHA